MPETPSNIRRSVAIRHPVWSSYGPQVTSGVVDFMRSHESWRLVTENRSYGEMEVVHIDRDWHGDGLILFRASEEELEAFRKRGQAVVLLSTEGPDLGYPRVVPDNARAGAMAAEHLIECAVPHFAFLARGETFYREAEFAPGLRRYARERLAGFRTKLGEYGCEPTVHYLKGRPLWKPQTWREVETEVMAFLDLLPKPCGLFVVDDSLGAVALRAADRLGIRVPQDLAVIGFGDDSAYCFATFPALSSIVYPGREAGRMAAELLSRQMKGEALPPGRTEIPLQSMVLRESSDTLAIADPEIRELVRQIRLRAPREALQVAELEQLTPLSMTTIKARFSTQLGHGPKQEIQRVRLRHLQQLLADQERSLADIARTMQFASAHELSRFFLAEGGERPSDFRKKLADAAAAGPEKRRGVIFDMDGTLFDTEPLYCEAFRRAYALQGGKLTKEEYFRELMGATNDAIESYLAAKAPPGFDAPRFSKDWRAAWKAIIGGKRLKPLPGVKDLLERLCEWGVPLALASSSDMEDIALCLEAAGLAGYFLVRAAGDEVTEGKPAPDVYLLACRRLGVEPGDCVAIEDSRRGVASALAAGMQVVWATDLPDVSAARVHKTKTLAELSEGFWEEMLAGKAAIKAP